ncbi:MAG: hypothetical protein L6R36_005212 [Xanthoria steineri]|nr:MAG: hypothetical protein L6R36_005212 [Xanthoria steineri]
MATLQCRNWQTPTVVHSKASFVETPISILLKDTLSRKLHRHYGTSFINACIPCFAGIERMNTKSLWSLMGIVVRNAERCGLHRDGILLGLPPYETEKRRRVWWELQHLDMALGVKSGSMSLSLQASWDARLPLNIEDEDIEPSMREAPEEREGLTSMSQCLWTYWVLDLQRSFCHADGTKLGFSWPADKSLSAVEKNTLIDRLETGLNKRYVQFCDPIRPLHLLVQILARAFICGMRRLTLHPLAHNGKISDLSEDHRKRLLDVCIQGLEYDVALHSNPSLKHFRWRFQGYFQWSALVYVLIEASRQFDTPKTGRIWALLSDIYAANPGLSDLSDDRRKSYAVELMTAAWRARESFLLGTSTRFAIAAAETHLPQPSREQSITSMPNKKLELAEDISCQGLPEETNALSQLDLATIADIDFDAIDWSFWESYS